MSEKESPFPRTEAQVTTPTAPPAKVKRTKKKSGNPRPRKPRPPEEQAIRDEADRKIAALRAQGPSSALLKRIVEKYIPKLVQADKDRLAQVLAGMTIPPLALPQTEPI